MRIAYYLETHLHGGLEELVLDLLRARKPEDDVIVVHNGEPRFSDRLRELGASGKAVETREVPLPHTLQLRERIEAWPPFLRKPAYGLILLLEHLLLEWDAERLYGPFHELRPDLLHIVTGGYPGPTSCLAAAVAARRAGVPRILFTPVSLAIPRKLPLLDRLLDARLSRAVDLWLPNSRAGAARLVALRGMPEAGVRAFYAGRGRPAPIAARAPGGTVKIGTVTVLLKSKGALQLIEAAASLEVPCEILIAGDGEDRPRLEAEIARRGLSGKVKLLGHVPDVAAFLDGLDIFAFTSAIPTEGLPTTILEAMSRGLPVAASAVGGVAEIVEDGVTGLIYEPGSAAALASALNRLAKDAAGRASLGAKGRERWERDFTWDALAARLGSLYAEASR